jgi:hypothetical protein
VGMAYSPLMLGALGSVSPSDSGTASGMLSTSLFVGGALGLTILTGFASWRTQGALAAGAGLQSAQLTGYQLAFAIGATCSMVAATVATLFLPSAPTAAR